MSTYKLIKEYPGSLPLNSLVKYHDGRYNCKIDPRLTRKLQKESVEKFPEFWEKVEYKLISYTVYDDTNLVTLRENGKYLANTSEVVCDNIGATIEEVRNFWREEDHKIYSVERLSDNKIFTIGDKVYQPNCKTNYFTVTGFEMDVNNEHLLVLGGNGGIRLSKIEHRNSLFITEDGVEIFEGDRFYNIGNSYPLFSSKGDWTITSDCVRVGTGQLHESKFEDNSGVYWVKFSTREAAEKYRLMNKPCLSINEVYSALHIPRTKLENLKILAKSKI